jgi:hypothetical protein
MRVIYADLPPKVRLVIVDEDTLVASHDMRVLIATHTPLSAAVVLGSLGLGRALSQLLALAGASA